MLHEYVYTWKPFTEKLFNTFMLQKGFFFFAKEIRRVDVWLDLCSFTPNTDACFVFQECCVCAQSLALLSLTFIHVEKILASHSNVSTDFTVGAAQFNSYLLWPKHIWTLAFKAAPGKMFYVKNAPATEKSGHFFCLKSCPWAKNKPNNVSRIYTCTQSRGLSNSRSSWK